MENIGESDRSKARAQRLIFCDEIKREREKRKKRSAFCSSLFVLDTKKLFFFRENTHVASSRSQRVSRVVVVVVVVVLLRVNVLMQKLNIRESCERKQD